MGAIACKACPAKAITLDDTAKTLSACLCSPVSELFMDKGKCVSCPMGTDCNGGGELKPASGFWMGNAKAQKFTPEQPGEIYGNLTLLYVPWATVVLVNAEEQATAALEASLAIATQTGENSVSVTRMTGETDIYGYALAMSDRVLVEFVVYVPSHMPISTVKETLATFGTNRRSNTFASNLLARLYGSIEGAAMFVPCCGGTSIESSVVQISREQEAVAVQAADSSSTEAYSCPFPQNCIPANNASSCALGATGPVCAICEDGYTLSKVGCTKCDSSGFSVTGSIETIIFTSIIALLSLWCLLVVISHCVADDQNEEDLDEKEKEKEIEARATSPLPSPSHSIPAVLPTDAPGSPTNPDNRNTVKHAVSPKRLIFSGPGCVIPQHTADVTTAVVEIDAAAAEPEGEKKAVQVKTAAGKEAAEVETAKAELRFEAAQEAGIVAIDAACVDDDVDAGGTYECVADLTGYLKIVIGQIQVVTAFVSGLDVVWPALMVDWSQMFGLVNLDIVSVAMPCMEWVTYYNSMAIILCTPICLSILVVASTYLLSFSGWLDDWKTTSISLILKLIFISFPAASAAPLKLFVCTEVYGVNYIAADYRLICSGEEYEYYMYLAIAGILIYPIGCPLLYATLLYRNKNKLHGTDEAGSKIRERLGFIYDRYEPDFYWWEVVEMIRKFFLTGLILFMAPGSIAQLASALMIGTYFMAAHVKYQPFILREEDNLQSMSLITTVLILIFGIMIKAASCQQPLTENPTMRKYDHPPAELLVSLCACTTGFGVILGIYTLRKTMSDHVKNLATVNGTGVAILTCLVTIFCCINSCCSCMGSKEDPDAHDDNSNIAKKDKEDKEDKEDKKDKEDEDKEIKAVTEEDKVEVGADLASDTPLKEANSGDDTAFGSPLEKIKLDIRVESPGVGRSPVASPSTPRRRSPFSMSYAA